MLQEVAGIRNNFDLSLGPWKEMWIQDSEYNFGIGKMSLLHIW